MFIIHLGDFFMSRFKKLIKVLSNINPVRYKSLTIEQTIDELIKNKKSLIRFGDGETAICVGRGIYFQEFETELQLGLLQILKEYDNNSPYLLALPNEFLSDYLFKVPFSKILLWTETRNLIRKYIHNQDVVGDAFLFRKYIMDDKKKIGIEKLWEEADHIICIGGNLDSDMMGRLFYEKEVRNIHISPQNGFSDYAKVLTQVENIFSSSKNMKKNNSVVIVSAGPVAKLLAFNLCKKGSRVYDVGFLMNPRPIMKKYS